MVMSLKVLMDKEKCIIKHKVRERKEEEDVAMSSLLDLNVVGRILI